MEEIAPNIWKLNVDSNVYLLDFDKKIVIDSGPPEAREIVKEGLRSKISLEDIEMVIFTHLHFDHMGNFDLFPNAKFFASKEEIEFFKEKGAYAILNQKAADRFNVELNPLEELDGFEIIKTPGHTEGGICLLYLKGGVLFSGDTLFRNGFGRTDFPGGDSDKLQESLDLLKNVDYKILAPGHDY